MRWPPWSSSPSPPPPPPPLSSPSDDNRFLTRQRQRLTDLWANKTDILLPTLVLTSSTLAIVYGYRNYVRRIPDVTAISPNFFRRRSLFGKVTSVGDGDGFRLFHTPGGRLLGWGWFPGRKVPETRAELKEKTLHIRIAGVDAPEAAHFGKKAQPHSAEALAWLREYLLEHRVRAYIYRRDQYGRVVASVKVRKGLRMKDVGLEMLEAGIATVYEAKMGAEFGKLEEMYRLAEWRAQKEKKGMWARSKTQFVSPYEYKKALRDAGEKVEGAAKA